jgi:hypothetical protein
VPHQSDSQGCRFIKLTIAGLAVPLGGALAGTASAADVVSETNARAATLGCKAGATKAMARKDPKADGSNCNVRAGRVARVPVGSSAGAVARQSYARR